MLHDRLNEGIGEADGFHPLTRSPFPSTRYQLQMQADSVSGKDIHMDIDMDPAMDIHPDIYMDIDMDKD
eukprot:5790193-Karenia_brevis.AAC.1